MDSLLRPCADMGVQADALIDWKYDVEKEVSPQSTPVNFFFLPLFTKWGR
jgi:hypothetical protein